MVEKTSPLCLPAAAGTYIRPGPPVIYVIILLTNVRLVDFPCAIIRSRWVPLSQITQDSTLQLSVEIWTVFSSNVAIHTLITAKDRGLGQLLPNQQS
jgi:hypothetical protein